MPGFAPGSIVLMSARLWSIPSMRDHASRLILYEKPAPPPGSSCMRQDWLLHPVQTADIIRQHDPEPHPAMRRQINADELGDFYRLIGKAIWHVQHLEDVMVTFLAVKIDRKRVV